MLNKSSWIHTTFNCLCLIGSGLCWTATAQAQVQRPPTQQPAAVGQANGVQPGGAGTKVQGKQLQQMFQAQSAQNQAQATARQAAGGQPTAGQAQVQPGQIPGQPVMRQQPGQGQPGQMQSGQARAGQAQQSQLQGQPGQPGQAQNAAGAPIAGQNVIPIVTPEQAAALEAAQREALAQGVVNPVAPFPPLTKEWQTWLDDFLTRWEAASGKVEKFQCEFVRYQFDPTVVSEAHYTYARGELKYLKPDKGLLKVNSLAYHSGTDEKGQPKYAVNPQNEFGEYWICDGENIYDMNRNAKVCTIHQLPPSMRGVGIQASPLPFIFGVKKKELEARYWIQPLPQPKDRPNEIWLEVYPRRADDAANYVKLQVVLDLKDWMPMGLIVFSTNWTPQSQHRELYQFEKRVVNATNMLPAMFQKEFIPAKPPADWKVIKEKYQEPQAEQPAQPKVAAPQQPGAPVLK